MRTGEYIYCHTTGSMDNGEVFGYAGEQYLIEDVNGNTLIICTECGPGHIWPMDDPLFDRHFSTDSSTKDRKRNSWRGNVLKFRFT